jgi:hypothetical protein
MVADVYTDDEFFVRAAARLFGGRDVRGECFEQARQTIDSAVAATPEEDVLSADVETWARGLAEDLHIDAPSIDADAAELVREGSVEVDCSGAPGISQSSSEFFGGQALRPGHRMRLSIPINGDTNLLLSPHSGGGTGLPADIEDGHVVRRWDWPEVKGPARSMRLLSSSRMPSHSEPTGSEPTSN